VSILELSSLGWVEVIDPDSVTLEEHGSGSRGIAYVGPQR
jgi:hypothetical protein